MPDERTVEMAKLYHETFAALRREHRCRKNAMEAVVAMQRILHEPTAKELATLRFLDNAHTVAFGDAEELLEKLDALENAEEEKDDA
jgi:hypothetical protein